MKALEYQILLAKKFNLNLQIRSYVVEFEKNDDGTSILSSSYNSLEGYTVSDDIRTFDPVTYRTDINKRTGLSTETDSGLSRFTFGTLMASNVDKKFIPCIDIDSPDISIIEKLRGNTFIKMSVAKVFKTTKGFHVYFEKTVDISQMHDWLDSVAIIADTKWIKHSKEKLPCLRFGFKGQDAPVFHSSIQF